MAFDPYHKWLGIPPEEQPPNHYRLLGITQFESDADVIETAAERQSLLLRTFQTGPEAELAERLLNEVATARNCLLDRHSKARYDQQLRVTLEPVPKQDPLAASGGNLSSVFDEAAIGDESSGQPCSTDFGGLDLPDGTRAICDMADQDLRSGIEGYRLFQERLAPEISPEEAAMAEVACRQRIRWFGFFFCGLLLAFLGLASLEAFEIGPQRTRLGRASVLYILDFLSDIQIAAIIFFVGWLRFPYAGRLLMPLAMVPLVTEMQDSREWLEYRGWEGAGIFFVGFTVLFFLGWQIDWAASLKKERRFPLLRRFVLTGLMGFMYLLAISVSLVEYGEVENYLPILQLVSASLMMILCWWPESRIPLRFLLSTKDAETVFDAGMKRWARIVLGRSLAIVLGMFPFFLLLNNLGVSEKLSWEGREETLLLIDIDGTNYACYDRLRARYLSQEDLHSGNIYAYDDAEIRPQVQNELAKHWKILSENPTEDLEYIQELLDPFAIRSQEQFTEQISALIPLKTARVIELSRVDPKRARFSTAGGSLHFVSTPLVSDDYAESPDWLWYSQDDAKNLIQYTAYLNWACVLTGIVALLLLWRRGGDSSVARWLGIWLVGAAALFADNVSILYLGSFLERAWRLPLDSAFGGLVIGPFYLVVLVGRFLSQMSALLVPVSFLWVHYCWPTSTLKKRPFLGRVLILLKLVFVSLAVAFVFVGMLTFGEFLDLPYWANMGITSAIVYVLLLTAGFVARRSRFIAGREAPSAKPVFGPLMGLTFICLIAGSLLVQFPFGVIATPTATQIHVLGIVGTVFLVLFLGLALYLMLRRDFLYMSDSNGLFYLALAFILPILIEVFQAIVMEIMEHLQVASERGAEVLGIVLAVFVLLPIEGRLFRFMASLSMRKLKMIESRVADAVDSICEVFESGERRQRINDSLVSCGIENYALYFRAAPGRFVLYSHAFNSLTVPEVELSTHIGNALRDHKGFVDLEQVCTDWPMFFHQFEFFRLEQQLGCRYLLPIKLGDSMRGILALPGTSDNKDVARHPMAQHLSTFGVAAFERPITK